jgi:DNA-binding NarL/FixJ family response regulator
VIRVLLAEDYSIVRAGLERLLGTTDDIEVVVGAEDGAQAVELAAEHKPDVVLMDISMPHLNGIEATKQIVEANEDVQVVVLTSFADRSQIVAALDAGAVGYLLKDAEPEEVIRGVRAAAKRESPSRRRWPGRCSMLAPSAQRRS